MAHRQSANNRSGQDDETTQTSAPARMSAGGPGQGAPQDDEMNAALAAFWESIKRLPAYLRLATTMARDPSVPRQAKGVLGVGAGYAISPVDLVPGVIPVAGQLDDLYIILTALQQAVKMTPAQIADRHLTKAGVRREDIDADLQAVRKLVRLAIVASLRFGGKTLGRVSRAATRFASRQVKRARSQRSEKPL